MSETKLTPAQPQAAEMKRLERREWALWNLAILAILGLTICVLLTPLVQWLGLGQSSVSGVWLVLPVFVLCLCLITAQRKMQRMRHRIRHTTRQMQEIALDLEGLRSLFKVTASVNSQMDLSMLLQMITREAVKTLKADHSSLMLLDESKTALSTAATYGEKSDEVENARVRLGEGVGGWVARFGKARLLQGRLDPKDFKNLIPKDRTISSAMCVPLRIEDQTLGVLNVNLLETHRQFTPHELNLLMIYANHAAVAVRNAALLRETKEKARMQAILEGYVSPQVARKLMKNPENCLNLGEVRELTVLFADIRGFTRVVHGMGPRKTRRFLNEVFTRLSEIIFENQGTLDKFIGDSVMAFFGAPLSVEVPALKAVESARSMVDAFEEIRKRWEAKSAYVTSLSLGVGISTGHLFIGNVGSKQRFDYTVIGQEVNLAKRLCDKAKKGQILLSESTQKALPPKFPVRHLGAIRFKGLDGPVPLFEVILGDNVPHSPPISPA